MFIKYTSALNGVLFPQRRFTRFFKIGKFLVVNVYVQDKYHLAIVPPLTKRAFVVPSTINCEPSTNFLKDTYKSANRDFLIHQIEQHQLLPWHSFPLKRIFSAFIHQSVL